MKVELLGTLTKDKRIAGAFNGGVTYLNAQVSLFVDPEGEALEECLKFAKSVVSTLAKIDAMAKDAAAKKLLETYNESWREYQKTDGKGGFIDVSDPEISAKQFKSRISMNHLSISGLNSFSVGYNDDGLFAGHSIFVTAFDGLAFSNVHVELFG